MGGSFFRAQKEDLAYETYNQGSYPASPLRKPLPSRKAGIICCIKTYPVFLSKEGLFNFQKHSKKHFWNTAETGSLITASMKPAGIRTLPGGIALLTGSLSRVIRF